MPEAVIVATARSPIGRAVKGSLATMRPDDLAALAPLLALGARLLRCGVGLEVPQRRAGAAVAAGDGGRLPASRSEALSFAASVVPVSPGSSFASAIMLPSGARIFTVAP